MPGGRGGAGGVLGALAGGGALAVAVTSGGFVAVAAGAVAVALVTAAGALSAGFSVVIVQAGTRTAQVTANVSALCSIFMKYRLQVEPSR